MEKQTFTGNTYSLRLLSVMLTAGAVLVWFRPDASWVPFAEQSIYIFPFFSLLIALILTILPAPTVEIDEKGIKRLNNANGWMSKLLRPDSECRWEWVASVCTYRKTRIDYATTVLKVPPDTPYKSRYLVSFESSLFENFTEILNAVKSRVPKAEYDMMTEAIIDGKTDTQAIKPFYFALVILIFISAIGLLLFFGII